MSDSTWCYICGKKIKGNAPPPCAACAGKTFSKATTQPTRTVALALVWQVTTKSGTVTPSGKSLFTSKISLDDAVEAAMTCLATHHTDMAETSYGEQGTLVKNGTVSVDYQGTREGDGAYWVDIQGQAGKSSDRYTLFQIMVQTHATAVPSRKLVEDAINRSFKGTCGVIRYDQDKMPK